jgi:hypothetical protein
VAFHSPRQAIREGFAFTPEDRKVEGIVPHLSVRENIILALLARQGTTNTLSRKRQEKIAEEFIKVLGIRTPGSEQAVMNLSGGNQQKVLLALETLPESPDENRSFPTARDRCKSRRFPDCKAFIVPDESIRIVHPTASWGEMKYGAIRAGHKEYSRNVLRPTRVNKNGLVETELDSELSRLMSPDDPFFTRAKGCF